METIIYDLIGNILGFAAMVNVLEFLLSLNTQLCKCHQST